MTFYLAQVVSALTALTAVITMQLKKMEWILIGQILANLLTAATYFLLGGLSGAGLCILAIGHTAVMYLFNRKGIRPHWAVGLGFIALYIACSAYYFESPVDCLSAMGAIFFALSVMQQKPAASRLCYVFNPMFWMIYDVFTLAYVSLLTHFIVFVSTVVAMIRVDHIFSKKKGQD